MKIETITLTPAIAEELLKRNTNNRNVKKERVLLYAHEIANNNWTLNGESIKISSNGDVLDGQHRLMAIIKANRPIKTVFISDLKKDVITTIDTGVNRSGGDVLSINGVKHSMNISAAITKFTALKIGRKDIRSNLKIRAKCSNTDILKEYNMNPDYWQTLHNVSVVYYRKWFRILSISDTIAYYAYFNTKFSEEIVNSFFESIINRTGNGALLYDRLLNDSLAKRKISVIEKNALVIKCFVNHVNDRVPKVLVFQKNEAFPTI